MLPGLKTNYYMHFCEFIFSPSNFPFSPHLFCPIQILFAREQNQVFFVEYLQITLKQKPMKTYTLRLLQFQPHILSFTLLVMLLNLGAIAQSSYIYIYAPYNGQVTYRNSPMDISWYSYGADTVNISYSTNAGASWTEIADNVTGIYYSSTTPNILSDQCLLRLTLGK